MRLFNPTTLQSAYALAKVQEVLWAKRSARSSQNKFLHGNERTQSRAVARTVFNLHGSDKGSRLRELIPQISNKVVLKQINRLTSKEM